MRALRTAVILVLALALSAPVLAADFQVGLEAAERGDYAKALREWRPLAEQGNADAQYNLGVMYYTGTGVTQDYAEALKWYRLAAEQGYDHAQFKLGWMYAWGWGVTPDDVQAHMWLNLAAARLPPGEDRDMAASNRDIVEGKMTPDQVAEAQRLAREWKPKRPLSDPNSIRSLQKALTGAGYDPGLLDGVLGDQTRNAIREFQRDHGLPVDGEATERILYKILDEAT